MRRLIGSAVVLLVVLLLVGVVVAAPPQAEKEAKGDKAKGAPASNKADAPKAKADGAKEEKSNAEAKPATEAKPDEKTKPKDQAKSDAQAKPPAAKAEPAKPKVHTVKRGVLKIQVSVKGVLESKTIVPIAIRPKEWKTLTPLDAKGHGARVAKGDVLIRFDTEKLDQAITDLKTSQRLAELGLKQADQQLRALEAIVPLDVAASGRAQRETSEDVKRYFAIDRPMSEKGAEFSLKSYREMLEYEEEELRQLEKMYKADDLTEETEEIILKRQRNVEIGRAHV